MVVSKVSRLILFVPVLSLALSGCSPEPATDCDRGLCGHKWALELDSALAFAAASLRDKPDDFNTLLGYADASIQKASFVYDQNKSREDFWLTVNLRKVDVLLDSALSACDRVLLRNKDAAEAYRLKGNSCLLKYRLRSRDPNGEESIRLLELSNSCLEKAVSLSPRSAEAWYSLGRLYQRHWRKSEKVRECFEKALECNPNHLLALAQLGQQYNAAGREYYAKARKLGSHDPDVLRLLEGAGSEYSKYEYLKTIQMVPLVAKLPIVVGIGWFLDDYDARRARFYRQIVRTERHFVDDHATLADNLFGSGMLIEAARQLKTWGANTDGRLSRVYVTLFGRKLFAQASKTYPATAWIYIAWGRQFDVDPDKEIGLFNEAIRLDSTSAIPYYLLAATYAAKEDWSSARKWLAQTLRRSAGDTLITVNAHLLSAFVHARQREFPQVIQNASSALRTDSAYAVNSLFRGIYGLPYFFSGEWFMLDDPIGSEFARSPSEKKVASLLNHVAGSSYYNRYLGRSYPKCTQFLQMAIEQDTENPDAYFALASAHSYIGENKKGIDVMGKLLQHNPKNAGAHRQLGLLYWGASRLDKAKQEFEKAIQLGDSQAKAWLEDLQKPRQ